MEISVPARGPPLRGLVVAGLFAALALVAALAVASLGATTPVSGAEAAKPAAPPAVCAVDMSSPYVLAKVGTPLEPVPLSRCGR